MAAMRRLHFEASPPKRLFDLLCRGGAWCSITSKDLQFISRWSPPPYVLAIADHFKLENLQKALVETHKSLLKAWWSVLDVDQTMRVTWTRFKAVCNSIAKTAKPTEAVPRNESEVASVWRALDKDCSGWIALWEFDQKAHEAVLGLKRYADAAHGGVVKFIRSLGLQDPTSTKVSKTVFRKALKDSKFSREVSELLFDSLDRNESGLLGELDVRFLDRWDLIFEESEAQAYREDPTQSPSYNPYSPHPLTAR